MKYVLLNLLVTSLVVSSLVLCRSALITRRNLYTLLLLLGLTAIFDSLIIYSGIVAYSSQHILGIYIGKAPIEDFFYAIVAAILGPALWDYYEHKK